MNQRATLVLATRNREKVREIQDILKTWPITLKDLDAFRRLPEVEEDGKTFEENAYRKAFFVAKELGLPAMADDSGLVVKALGGAPGIHSARYAGLNADAEQRYSKLLRELEGCDDREAAFECVIAIVAPNGQSLTYRGRCEGVITTRPIGTNGFGYDPVFYYPPLKKTFGELTVKEKDGVSHRGRALAELRRDFDKLVAWLINQNREK
jgi:XTP/dITP diphosphohydrolase